MALPLPIPDNPMKWEGWRSYNSPNPYDRLCLDFDANPNVEQIEENCRQLLVWWQKKLPLKNQPSNPIAQLLRAGLDEAPRMLVEAKTELLDPIKREQLNLGLRNRLRESAVTEIKKFFSFAIADNQLTPESENNLYVKGESLGLTREVILDLIEEELDRTGAKRFVKPEPAELPAISNAPARATNAFDEFRRLLRLSGLNDDDMTDDQRDALCNMGENLGLTGGQAEDLIDEYLEEVSGIPLTVPSASSSTATLPPPVARPAVTTPAKAAEPKASVATSAEQEALFNIPPLRRVEEREKFPNFVNSVGQEMLLITSGVFMMGSDAPGAAPAEQPISRVLVNCFHMSRFPITNAQYEQFDPSHRAKRAPWSNDRHPVVYVNCQEAARFCEWLSAKEKRRYRLPTEAEWEYAARGADGRSFPWGEKLNSGSLANFADANTNFAWSAMDIDDGYAQTSPVGSYPKGASPFGIEDLSGNVWEWCNDFYEKYTGRDRINARNSTKGTQRIYRGGSWKSRVSSLRASTRGWNLPNYSSNDVGFRIICECD